jgi:predicted nucleic acid-binding protein
VLARPELKIRSGPRRQVLQLIKNHSRLVRIIRPLRVAKDPGDDKFLECADAARADYLVTGNQRDFPKFWKRTKVITSREFTNIVAPHFFRGK